MKFNSENGFTLIELISSICVFVIISLTLLTLLNYVIKTNANLTEKSINLEEARIAMDLIETHIKSIEGYKLVNQIELQLYEKVKNNIEVRTFKFNKLLNQILFGTNKLAENIKDLQFEIIDDIIIIKIITKARKYDSEFELIGQVSVKYKINYK